MHNMIADCINRCLMIEFWNKSTWLEKIPMNEECMAYQQVLIS